MPRIRPAHPRSRPTTARFSFPADIGADTQTPGGVQLNPGGNPGAAQVYASPDGKQQIIDTILVFPDVGAADSNFQSNSATLNTVVTGPPEPVEIGTNGVMAVGTSPDGSKEVTVILFTQDRALVSTELSRATPVTRFRRRSRPTSPRSRPLP